MGPRWSRGDDRAALEHAISTLESQRGVLSDASVNTALAPLLERRSAVVRRPEGVQRRSVTVVLADLVGFTDLSSRLDAEDTRNISTPASPAGGG